MKIKKGLCKEKLLGVAHYFYQHGYRHYKNRLLLPAVLIALSSTLAHPSIYANTLLNAEFNATATQAAVSLYGKWVTELDGSTMLDPQSSGLIANELGWWTVSDASADASQIQRLHVIDKNSAAVIKRYGPMALSETVLKSCFAQYLAGKPDYEALTFHPFKDNAWILVTEDATRGKPMSKACKKTFSETGSTRFPTLLVEVVLSNSQLVVSGVRAVQFDSNDQVGNFPNDGIEGLAFGRNNRLYMGLEKDKNSQPRIFYVDITPDFFTLTDTFIAAKDAELALPGFTKGNHPINGMDIYFPDSASAGFLIAAARNDNALWIIDLAKVQPTKIVPLSFYAPGRSANCPEYYEMDNASLEGVAVDGNTLVLINDPWKTNYLKNVVCESDKAPYKRMSPLVFTTEIQKAWITP